MTARSDELAVRRIQLQQRCESQRQQVRGLAQHIEARLSGLDRGLKALSFFTHRPGAVLAGLASAFVFGPKRMLRWWGRGTLLISLMRKLAGLASRF